VIERARHLWLWIRLNCLGSIEGLTCVGRGIGKEGALIAWTCDRCGADVTREAAW